MDQAVRSETIYLNPNSERDEMSNLNMNDIDELVILDDVALANTLGGAKKSKSSSSSKANTKSQAVVGAVTGGPVLTGEDGDVTEEYALSQLYYSSIWGTRV